TLQRTIDTKPCTAGMSPIQHKSLEALGAQATAHRQIPNLVREPPVNSQLRYSELGIISSVKGKSGITPIQFGKPLIQRRL
ncbi:hypothetical protein HAX54_027844, partial [Datura stramonium]|nr:hypothetical protein [Datura stramonium]